MENFPGPSDPPRIFPPFNGEEFKMQRILLVMAVVFLFVSGVFATIFGTVRGVVHDPQHRPVADAAVKLKSATSDWTQTAQTDQDGAFLFTAVPVGDYQVTVTRSGFAEEQETVTVVSASSPTLHFQLKIASVNQTTTVLAEGQGEVANVDSVTPTTLVARLDIAQTPGADRTNALQMITDYVPAAYVTHDMLHMRGGHQVDWLIDGVPIPNTNIATNLGPVIDPKDIDYLEVQRGSYEADYGDRTYGIFNIVPRTGFERNNEAELVLSLGNWDQTNDQINFGGHTERFAYYASLNGNRSNYGLQTPIGQVFHDAENGYGDSRPSSTTPIPRTNFDWSRPCGRTTTRFPTTRIPIHLEISRTPATAFAMASTKPTAMLRSPGSTHSMQTCCLRFRPFITTAKPTTKPHPTTRRWSRARIKLPIMRGYRRP